MKRVWLIFRKELQSALRDRRVLLSTVLIPLVVLPIVTTLPLVLVGGKERTAREKPSSIALVGLPYDELEQTLRDGERFTFMATESAAREIRLDRLDAAVEVLSLPAGRESGQLRILFNATRTESRTAADKLKLALAGLNRRLLARQVDTTQVNLDPLKTTPANVASEKATGGFIVGMLIAMMAVIGLINGGMVVAIDSTAGEKERKTLEVLLAAPIRRSGIVLGKFLAAMLSAMVSVVLMTTGYGFSMTFGLRALGGSGALPMTVSVSPGALLVILAALLVLAAFLTALEIGVSIFARSYREAQNYLVPLPFLAIVPGILLQTIQGNPAPELFLIPLLNVMLLIREMLMGSLVAGHVVNTFATTLVCAVLALRFAFAVFRRESAVLR